MRLEPVDAQDARAVLRGLRGAVLGAGPAIAVGAAAGLPEEVPAGTALVVTTSGSTGYPKSVVLTRSALTSSALATAERIGEGSWLLALSPGYIAGVQVLVRSLVSGREPAILSGSFSAHAFAAAAGSLVSSRGGHRVARFTALVPAQVATLLDSSEGARALASFDAVLVGGQATPPSILARAADAGAKLVRTYGASETAGGCVYDGIPLRDVRARVEDGEVLLAAPMLADGYLGEPERTAASFVTDDEGRRWYRTGDAGTVDPAVRITGRIDNVIVSGGVNVSLDRVEQTVRGVPGLEQAVIVAAPDARWGQTPVLVAAHVPDPAAALRAARDAVAEQLGAPARPSRILVVDETPLLPSGKPDRGALAARAAARPAED